MNTSNAKKSEEKESYAIQAHNRHEKKAKETRRQRLIPAIVYGHGIQPLKIGVSSKEFMKIFHRASTSHVIILETEDKHFPALVHNIQRNPLTREILHIDFYHVVKGDKVSAEVPLLVRGISPGVKDYGCTLVTHIREIEVQALPEELPSSIEIDISHLSKAGDEITVKNLPISKGVNFLTPKDVAIVSLIAAKKDEGIKTEEAGLSEEAGMQEKKQDTK